jgi:predicted alpha/beta hydrolase
MPPATIAIRTADRYRLQAQLWQRSDSSDPARPVAIIAPATSVHSRYYARFAGDLFDHGHDVITFDYRGIGGSRQGSLRGFAADWLDWGRDLDAVLAHVAAAFPARPIDVVGHSIGGFLLGLAPNATRVRRVFTVGAQYAYWRDYARAARWGMLWRWHVLMPLLAALCGYVPARRLGWMEDTPSGVARHWSRMGPRFERSLTRGCTTGPGADELVHRFGAVTAPILALGLDDDPFGTTAAIDRLLAYFTAADRHHQRLEAAALGFTQIGHFAFFHERFRDTLWPLARAWLQDQRITMLPGATVTTWPGAREA